MKILAYLLAAPAGAFTCFHLNRGLTAVFDKEQFFGHVLNSPVNWFTFATLFVLGVMMLNRLARLRQEASWQSLGVLPVEKEFASYDQVEPFAKLESAMGPRRKFRPLCLLRTCFDSVRVKWCSAECVNEFETTFRKNS